MNIYKIPFDFEHEEKVFGGYLSLRQMIYIVLGIASFGILFIPIIPMIIKILLFITLFILFMMCAFLKIQQSYSDKYLINILKFVFKKKIYTINK